MSRIIEDIRQYFREQGIDIIAMPDIRQCVRTHQRALVNYLTRREDFINDLIVELLWAESNMDNNAKQMRSLLTLKRRVIESGIVEWVLNKSRGQLWEEDEP